MQIHRLITVLALLVFCGGSQASFVTPVRTPTEAEKRRTKLAQMAVFVNALSQGKSRLMLKAGVSANPGGRPGRPAEEYGNDFLTVYPLTIPVNARLPMAPAGAPFVQKYGRMLGAVEVITAVGGPEDKTKAESGVYLLFVPINGPITSEMPLWLVSVEVADDGQVTYEAKAHTTVQITRSETGASTRSPSVSASIDFVTAAALMTWSSTTYKFGFRMEVHYR